MPQTGKRHLFGGGAADKSLSGESSQYTRRGQLWMQNVTADDVDPVLLAHFPNLVEELNAVIVHARDGDSWAAFDITLAHALALPTWGSA